MKKVLRVTLFFLLALVASFVGGFLLSHLVSDVIFTREPIYWLWHMTHWIRDHFVPSIVEPDDMEGLYIIELVLICWIAVFATLIAAVVVFRRRCVHVRRAASDQGTN